MISKRTIFVVTADAGDSPPIACGGSPESAMGVRSVELSASLKSFLSVCLKPLVVLPWVQLRIFCLVTGPRSGQICGLVNLVYLQES